MNYGLCEGGPYDGRPLVHHTGIHQVAYERHRPSRAVPGLVTSLDPAIAWGCYAFHPLTGKWHWFESHNTMWVTSDRYAMWIRNVPVTGSVDQRDVTG